MFDMPPVAERIGRTAAVAAMVVGAVVVVGWVADLPLLTRLGGGDRPATTLTTAVMVVVGGATVLVRRVSRWAYVVLAAAIAVVGVLVVGEWTVGLDLGLYRDVAVDGETRAALGRPSPSTAVALSAFGLAALCLPRRARWPRVGAAIAMGVFVASVLSIELGYLFEVPELIGVGHGVPIPSALALGLLAVALLAQCADRPPVAWIWEAGVARRIGRTLVPIAFLTPILVGVAARLGQRVWDYTSDFRLVLFATSMAVVLTTLTIAVGIAMVRAERASDRLAGELAATFEHLPASMSLRSSDGVFLRANRRFADDTHLDPEAIVGRSMADVYPVDILPWAQKEIDDVLATGRQSNSEYTADLGDGPRTFAVTRYPVYDSAGAPIGVGTFSLDITARVEAERAVAEAAARAESFLASAPDATVIVDPDGVIRYANHQVTTMLGYLADELVGRTVDVLVPDEFRAGHVALRTAYAERPSRRSMAARDLRARHKDGHEIPVEISLGPVTSDGEDLVLAAVRDVSGQRAAELALRDAEERQRTDLELAGMVQQRLLPSEPPSLPGYDLASRFIPAGAVGGDLYDWWADDGRLLLVVADVMGKGAGAAIVGAGIRSSLTKEMTLAEPGVAMARAAADLSVDLARTGRFVTCFAAELDRRSGRLDWVDAGHGLALVRRADGSVQWLRSKNLPLGVDAEAGWTQESTVLEPGDVLVAASDGLLDEIGTSADLVSLVGSHAAANAGDVVDTLTARLSEPADDVTLLVLRREESA